MNNLNNKKKYTNEDYVNHINSIIGEDYEMYTTITTELKKINTDNNEEEIVEVQIEKNVITHKTCGCDFEMKHDTLISKIKNKLVICPCCRKTKNKK